MDLPGVWGLLENEKSKRHGIVTRRVNPKAPCDVRLGIEKPSNAKLLIVRVLSRTLRSDVREFSSAAIEVLTPALPPADSERTDIAIKLGDDRYSDLFSTLVEDLIRDLSSCTSEPQTGPALIARLRRWQELLKRLGPGGLSQDAQNGFFAELWFLREYLLPALGPSKAVPGWTGPEAANQDFQFGKIAFEVKSSVGQQHQKMLVASERQLDDTGLQALVIFFVSLDVRPGSEMTLRKLVQKVRDILSAEPLAAELFDAKLLASGYIEAQSHLYDRVSYTVRSSAFFRVAGKFPRVIERDLIPGVGDVGYSILVSACSDFLISRSEIETLIREVRRGRRK
jgi:hypothetical protein